MEENKDNDVIYDLEHVVNAVESGEAETASQPSGESMVMESGHFDRCAEGATIGASGGDASVDVAADTEQDIAEVLCDSQHEISAGGADGCASGAAVNMTALHEETAPDTGDNDEDDENAKNAKSAKKAEREINRMVKEMGADTLLEIIRDNRNAAIRQIIREVEATQIRVPPSGVSCAAPCSSIFDLAALA